MKYSRQKKILIGVVHKLHLQDAAGRGPSTNSFSHYEETRGDKNQIFCTYTARWGLIAKPDYLARNFFWLLSLNLGTSQLHSCLVVEEKLNTNLLSVMNTLIL